MADFKSIKDIMDRLNYINRDDEILGIDVRNRAVQLFSDAFFKAFDEYESDYLGDGFTAVSQSMDGVRYYAYYIDPDIKEEG